MNVICFSQALDLVGGTFQTPKLDKFMNHWFRISQHSSKAKLQWQEKTGQSFKSYTLQLGGGISGSVKNR